MKTINAIVKILTALAAVAGAVYIIATYGDQIVAWAKGMMNKLPTNDAPAAAEVPAEEPAAATEEAPVAESTEAAEEPAAAEENAPVADDADFEG